MMNNSCWSTNRLAGLLLTLMLGFAMAGCVTQYQRTKAPEHTLPLTEDDLKRVYSCCQNAVERFEQTPPDLRRNLYAKCGIQLFRRCEKAWTDSGQWPADTRWERLAEACKAKYCTALDGKEALCRGAALNASTWQDFLVAAARLETANSAKLSASVYSLASLIALGDTNFAVSIEPLAAPQSKATVDECPDPAQCAEKGLCGQHQGGVCAPRSDTDCENSAVCVDEARCERSADGLRCVATPETCAEHSICYDSYKCDASAEGKCVATAAGCRLWPGCSESGDCAYRRGMCVAGTNDACAQALDCYTEGRCSNHGDVCAPSTPAHCAAAQVCSKRGRCVFSESKAECVATKTTCRNFPGCQLHGWCSFDKVSGTCYSRHRSDCKKVCAGRGACSFSRDELRCFGTTASCKRWKGCKAQGRCSLAPDGYCAAISDTDCSQSGACKGKNKRCFAVFGECVAAPLPQCQRYSRCQLAYERLLTSTSLKRRMLRPDPWGGMAERAKKKPIKAAKVCSRMLARFEQLETAPAACRRAKGATK